MEYFKHSIRVLLNESIQWLEHAISTCLAAQQYLYRVSLSDDTDCYRGYQCKFIILNFEFHQLRNTFEQKNIYNYLTGITYIYICGNTPTRMNCHLSNCVSERKHVCCVVWITCGIIMVVFSVFSIQSVCNRAVWLRGSTLP